HGGNGGNAQGGGIYFAGSGFGDVLTLQNTSADANRLAGGRGGSGGNAGLSYQLVFETYDGNLQRLAYGGGGGLGGGTTGGGIYADNGIVTVAGQSTLSRNAGTAGNG